jgi:hypothetical protein
LGYAGYPGEFLEVLGVLVREERFSAEIGVEGAKINFSGDDDEKIGTEVIDLSGDVLLDAESDTDEEKDGD